MPADVAAPRVSIGVPVRNGERYLAECLDSILGQTYGDFEVVVSDNGSDDATPDIIREYERRDDRVRGHRSDNDHGAGWNFNRVLELSRGRYFKWQAHDDLLTPTFLERTVAVLDDDDEATVAYTHVDFIDAAGERTRTYDIHLDLDDDDRVERFRETTLAWHLCLEIFGLLRTSAVRRAGGMGNFGHGDGVLLAHLALEGRLREVPEPLFLSREHEGQSMRQFGYEGGGNDYHRYVVWFDPTLAGRLTFPNWRIIGEYQRAVWSAPSLELGELVRLEAVLARRARQDARNLLSDLQYAYRFVGARSWRRSSRSGTT